MITHVLIINPQLAFTVALKQALERTGSFDVHPFTTADAAIEFLQDHPQDVALLQITGPGTDAATLIHALRSIQPDLPIVISPQQPQALMQRLGVQESINAPFTARDVIPLLNSAAAARDTVASLAPPPPPPPSHVTQRLDVPADDADLAARFEGASGGAGPLYDENIFDLDLDEIGQSAGVSEDTPSQSHSPRDFDELVRSSGSDEGRRLLHERTQSLIDFTLPGTGDLDRPREPGDSTRMFRQLADEEPPMPGLEDEGTVGDLMSGVVDTGFRDVLAILRGEATPETEESAVPTLSDDELQSVLSSFYDVEDDVSEVGPFSDIELEPPGSEGRNTARVILETTFDESTPPEQFSLDDLISSIEQQLPEHRPNVQPLPSWLRDTEPVVAEPDFLPEEPARVLPLDFTGDLYDQTTRPSSQQRIETRAGDMETEMVEPVTRSQPADFSDVEPAPLFADEDLPEEWAAVFDAPDAEAPVEPVTPVAADDWEAAFADAPLVEADEWADVFEAPPEHVAEAAEAESFEDAEPRLHPLEAMPDDLDASVEPLLMEKFTGVLDDSRAFETVTEPWQDADLDAWTDEERAESAALDGEPDTAALADDVEQPEPDVALETSAAWSEPAPPDEAEAETTYDADWGELEAVDAEELTWMDEPVPPETAAEPSEPLEEERWAQEDALEGLGPWPVVELPDESTDESVPPPPTETPEPERAAAWGAYLEELPAQSPPDEVDEPPVYMGERLPELPAVELPEFDTALFDTSFNQLAAFDFPDAEVLQFQPQVGARPVDDPRIAQVALSLTHASLESTAEATLLTHHGQIIGFAGDLTREDLEELRQAVSQWDNDIEQAHVGFVTLASNNRVVMVYTCRTVGELALSMIFAGSTPLRDIRRQGKRMVEALESTPEPEVALQNLTPIIEIRRAGETAPEPADVGPLVAQGALWLLADPNVALDEEAAEALSAGMQLQLAEQHWRVHAIEAREDYVYVFADMPAERPQAEIVSELKQRAGTILRAVAPALDAGTLWSDGYMVVSPGRLLEHDEIQDFVNFERM